MIKQFDIMESGIKPGDLVTLSDEGVRAASHYASPDRPSWRSWFHHPHAPISPHAYATNPYVCLSTETPMLLLKSGYPPRTGVDGHWLESILVLFGDKKLLISFRIADQTYPYVIRLLRKPV
jgi:hypothetical protein